MHKFEVLERLGEGAMATVYRVKRLEDSQVYSLKACKVNGMSSQDLNQCLNEVRILSSINSPYVVGYKDSFYDQKTKNFCVVMEFAEGGDLSRIIERLRKTRKTMLEEDIWKFCLQLCHGLKSLHKLDILHRDVKSANILLNKDHSAVKLADMNVSKVTKNGLAYTQTGTPYYASPEVWQEGCYDQKCDIWSLGCVLYQMAALKPPFFGSDIPHLKKNVLAGTFDRIPLAYSQELESFIRKCLTTNPKQRPSVEQLIATASLRKRALLYVNEKYNELLLQPSRLINTIRLNNRFHSLKEVLPKDNYKYSDPIAPLGKPKKIQGELPQMKEIKTPRLAHLR